MRRLRSKHLFNADRVLATGPTSPGSTVGRPPRTVACRAFPRGSAAVYFRGPGVGDHPCCAGRPGGARAGRGRARTATFGRDPRGIAGGLAPAHGGCGVRQGTAATRRGVGDRRPSWSKRASAGACGRARERVPVDGGSARQRAHGSDEIDLTGETMPVTKDVRRPKVDRGQPVNRRRQLRSWTVPRRSGATQGLGAHREMGQKNKTHSQRARSSGWPERWVADG